MMIDRIQKVYGVGSVEPVRRRSGQKGLNEPGGEGAASDGLEVSSFGREMSRAVAELRKVPDVRADKVQDLRERVASGTYCVDSANLASRLIEAGLLGDLGD